MSIIVADISLPPSSSAERTDVVIKEVEKIASSLPEVHSIFHVNGFGIFGGAGSSYGVLFMKLKDWDERKKKGQDVQSLIGKLFGMTSSIKGATVIFLRRQHSRDLVLEAVSNFSSRIEAAATATSLSALVRDSSLICRASSPKARLISDGSAN